MLNRTKFYLISLGLLNLLLFCKDGHATKNVQLKYLPEEGCWIVDHSVVRITMKYGPHAGKTLRFPIYNGTGPEIDQEELYLHIPKPKSGPRIGQSYCVIVPAGKVEKTVRQIIDFYSKNVLKGIDVLHPEYIGECKLSRAGSCVIESDFTGGFTHFGLSIDGVGGQSFNITFPSKPGQKIIVRNIWDIPIAEKGGWENSGNSKNRKDAIIKWWLSS